MNELKIRENKKVTPLTKYTKRCEVKGCQNKASAFINQQFVCQRHFTSSRYQMEKKRCAKCQAHFRSLNVSRAKGEYEGRLLCYRCFQKTDGYIPMAQPGTIKSLTQ